MNMLTPTPPLQSGPAARPAEGPHVSGPAGWAILMAFLGVTLAGIVLYLVRLAEAAT